MFDSGRVRVGAVPNAWSNDDLPDLGAHTTFEQTIDEMALAGYEGTEMGSKYPTDAKVLRAAVELRGLEVSGAWFSAWFASAGGAWQQTLDGFREQVGFFREVGLRDVYVAEVTDAVHQRPVPALANRPHFDDDRWEALTRGLDEMGAVAAEHGLRVCYHHHVGTAVQDNDDVERLMAHTDPSRVWLLLDTAHITVGGGDAMRLARDHADRIGHVHLKQVRAGVLDRMRADGLSFWDALRAGIFTVPGDPEGMLDLEPVLEVLDAAGYEGWLNVEAEQDPAKADPLAYFRLARTWLQDTAGLAVRRGAAA